MMPLSKYKICPECGKQNPPSLFECKYCETDLTGVKVVEDTAEKSPAAETNQAPVSVKTELVRICECGAENAPQARKCKVCGEDISDIRPVQAEKHETKVLSYELKSLDETCSVTIDKPLVVIGREAELKEYLQAKVYVSRQHAKLTVVGDKVFIENLSHTNKTFLTMKRFRKMFPPCFKMGMKLGSAAKWYRETGRKKQPILSLE